MAEKRARVHWKSDVVDKTFLEACIHEVTTNGREGSSLKPSSWKVVAEKLKSDHDFVVDQRQMKNRYDYLKGKYGAWVKLKNKTGNVYNPITNTFNLSDEEWNAEMKSNKFVEKVKNAPLPCPDLCIKLFVGVTSTGVNSWGPASTFPRPVEDHNMDDVDDVQCTQMETPTSTVLPPVSEESCGQSKPKTSTKNGKGVRKNKLDEEMDDVGKEIINVAKMLLKTNNIDNDMDECMEKLEKMEWGEEDPRYQTALLLFGEGDHTIKVWLRLKPASCESWVRNAGRKFGLLG